MTFETPAESALSLPFFSLRAMAPQRKLVAALVYSLAVSLLLRPFPAGCACAFSLLLLLCSGLPLRTTARRLLAVNAFFPPLWLLLPLSFAPRSGEVAAYILGPMAFYPSGLELALLITLKGNAIAAALLALAGSSTVAENGKALALLGLPQKLVALLLITHNNLELMAREYKSLFQAARLRAFNPRSNAASYATYARLLGLLLTRSWHKARRVDEAMRLRGFAGRFPVLPSRCTCPPRIKARNRRSAALLLAMCLAASLVLSFWDRFI